MPTPQSLNVQIFGFSASASGEVAIYSLVAIVLAFILFLGLRRRH
jgi:hypothetical protein